MATNKVSRIRRLVESLYDLRQEAEVISQNIAETQANLIDGMEGVGLDATNWQDEDNDWTATVVRSSTVSYDADKLKANLSASQWKRITKSVVDRALIDAAIADGTIPPAVVAKCVSTKDRSPYVKVTRKDR